MILLKIKLTVVLTLADSVHTPRHILTHSLTMVLATMIESRISILLSSASILSLALEVIAVPQGKAASVPSPSASPPEKKTNAGIILGIMVPVLIFVGLFIFYQWSKFSSKRTRQLSRSPNGYHSSDDLNQRDQQIWNTYEMFPQPHNLPISHLHPASHSAPQKALIHQPPPVFAQPPINQHPYFLSRNKDSHEVGSSLASAPLSVRVPSNTKVPISRQSSQHSAILPRSQVRSRPLAVSPSSSASRRHRGSPSSFVFSGKSYYAVTRSGRSNSLPTKKSIVHRDGRHKVRSSEHCRSDASNSTLQLVRPFPMPMSLKQPSPT
jgi:hypothetical protein